MNCLLRKFILRQINQLLEDHKDNIESTKDKVWVWMKRADAINKFLQGLYEKLSDNNLTEDELKASIEGLKNIVQTW